MTAQELTIRAIGAHMRAYQKLHGYSIKDMASVCGLGKNYALKIMSGLAIPTLDDVCQIAETLEMEPHELLTPVNRPLSPSDRFIVGDMMGLLESLEVVAQVVSRRLERTA